MASSAQHAGSPGVFAGASLLRAAVLLLALSSSMAADAGSRTRLLTGQNLRRIRHPHLDEGDFAIARPVRHARNHVLCPRALLGAGGLDEAAFVSGIAVDASGHVDCDQTDITGRSCLALTRESGTLAIPLPSYPRLTE